MKVYILTRGSYSDYHISKVFLSKKQAQDYAKRFGTDHYNGDFSIEEWDTSDDAIEFSMAGWEVTRYVGNHGFIGKKRDPNEVWWDIEFLGIGEEENYRHESCLKNEWDTWISTWGEEKGSRVFNFYLLAPNKETALKVANERYAQIRVAIDQGLIQLGEGEDHFTFPGGEKIK